MEQASGNHLYQIGHRHPCAYGADELDQRKLSAAKWNSRNAGGLKMDLLPLGFLRKIR
jgi:hypothetical protein